MDISELSKTESRQLILVNSKTDYSEPNKVAALLKLLKEKDYFRTDAGQVYKGALENIVAGKTPIDCIYCKNPLDADDVLICAKCAEKLYDRVNRDNKERLAEKAEFERAQQEARKLAEQLHDNDDNMDDDPVSSGSMDLYEYTAQNYGTVNTSENIYKNPNYAENTDAYSNSDTPDSHTDLAEPAAGSETETYFSAENLSENTEIQSEKTDKQSGEEKKTLKNAVIHWYMEHSAAFTIIITCVIIILMVSMLILEHKYSGGGSKNDSYNISSNGQDSGNIALSKDTGYLRDGFELMGEDYTKIDDEYGENRQMMSDNICYYPECGVSIVFNEKNDRIIYIENDGTGTGKKKVPILGIVPGDSTVKAKKALMDNGLSVNEIGDNTLMAQFGKKNDPETTYEVDISYDNDAVDLICIRIIK